MIINGNFIQEVVSRIHANISNQSLCSYANWTPLNGNYSDSTYQGIYALRYLPAYYFEYAVLANILSCRIRQGEYDSLNIASFGCGLYPDYFALEHNLTHTHFTYVGYDSSDWQTRKLMPDARLPLILSNQPIDDINEATLGLFDVFIFPKSIGDIGSTSNLDVFAEKIGNTKKNRLFFLNSFIIKDNINNENEVALFSKLHEKLLSKGFMTNDNHEQTKHKGAAGSALWLINNNYQYPSGFALCTLNKTQCSTNCAVRYSPILTNKNMGFQFLEYKR